MCSHLVAQRPASNNLVFMPQRTLNDGIDPRAPATGEPFATDHARKEWDEVQSIAGGV